MTGRKRANLRTLDELIKWTYHSLDAHRHRQRAVRLKSELKARHDAAPDDYLSGKWPERSGGIVTGSSKFEPTLPPAVRRQIQRVSKLAQEAGAAYRANPSAPPTRTVLWVTDLPRLQRRKHRETGGSDGHPLFDDTGIAVAVRALARIFGTTNDQAKHIVAETLRVDGVRGYPAVTRGAATARVRRALTKYPPGAITNAGIPLR